VLLTFWENQEDPREGARAGRELWVPAYRGDGRYFVSNLGHVCSNTRGRGYQLLKTTRTSHGYASVGVYPQGSTRSRSATVHRLVVLSFDGEAPSPDQTDVLHLSEDPNDNRLCNLRHGTRQENMLSLAARRLAGQQSLQDVFDAEARAWTWYDLPADKFLQSALYLYGEGKLRREDLARVWCTTTEVVDTVLYGPAFAHLSRPAPPRKTRRLLPAQAQAIRDLIREGKTRDEVNETLGLSLNHQDFYYYKTKA